MNTRRTTTPKSVQASRLNRRDFLIRGGLMGAGALSLPALLAACGSDSGSTADTVGGGGDSSLFFENWPGYMDEETIGLFQAASGVSLKYTEAFNDNNEYFAKIQPEMSKGKTIAPDILAPTFWMAARLVQLGWVQKLPKADIPNFVNLRDDLSGQSWDKNDEYHLPYQSGIAGIAYNSKITGRELKSVADLFDPAFKGKIGMLTEMRDTIGLAMLANGDDPAKADRASFDRAIALIEPSVTDGTVRAFTGNDYKELIVKGDVAACVAWRGDTVQIGYEDPNIVWVTPTDGCTFSSDNMLIPLGAAHKYTAEKWMDWYYKPEIAAQLTAYVQYVSPVKGTKEEIAKIDATLATDPFIFPDAALEAQLNVFAGLSEEDEIYMNDAYSALQGN